MATQALINEPKIDHPASVYASRVKEALLRKFESSHIKASAIDGPDITFVGEDGRSVVIEVKYRSGGALGVSEIADARRQLDRYADDQRGLLVTNAPLSDEVRQYNSSNPGFSSGIEVLTWNDDRDDDLLARALLRQLA